MAQILLIIQAPTFPSTLAHLYTHSKGFWGPAEWHVSSPLSAVFAVKQARGAMHLWKRVATRGKGRKEGCSVERPRPREKRKEQPQNSFPLQRERRREGERQREEGTAGTMSLQLQVQWLQSCVCRAHFLFCVNWADLLSLLRCKFNSQLINMWPFCVCRVCVCVCARRITEWAPLPAWAERV